MQSFENMEKTGYLREEFRLFHIKDQTEREYHYHYHDFHKIIVFLSGRVIYHIEGKAYHLEALGYSACESARHSQAAD